MHRTRSRKKKKSQKNIQANYEIERATADTDERKGEKSNIFITKIPNTLSGLRDTRASKSIVYHLEISKFMCAINI